MAYIQQKAVKSYIMLFDAGHFPAPVPKMFTGQYWKTQNAITGQATGRGTTYFFKHNKNEYVLRHYRCLLYTSPSPRDRTRSRMPSSA